jgi:preprotein translocase subunit SecA
MEDDLMRLFGGERMKSLMTSLGLPDEQPIEAKMVSRSIESAQKKIEGLNFDTRKHVLEFDDVLNHQRNIIYKIRRRFLPGYPKEKLEDQKTLKEEFLELIKNEFAELATQNLNALDESGNIKEDWDSLIKTVGAIIPVDSALANEIKTAAQNAANKEFAVVDALSQKAVKLFEEKEKEMGEEVFDGAMRFVALQAMDTLWMEHLDTMDHLRDSVRLRGYGQRDPLVEYKKEGFVMFQNLIKEMNKQMVYTIFHINVQPNQVVNQQISTPSNVVTNKTESLVNSGNNSTKTESVGRNDPCPCGAINPETGKVFKYKKCGMINAPYHKKS